MAEHDEDAATPPADSPGRSAGAPHAISRGGCHCGRIAYEVAGRPLRVTQCNCSICTKKGYLHWIVPRADFRLLTPIADLLTYTFNTHAAKHHFCPRCGVAPFYIARSDPDKIDVNVRCLEDVDPAEIEIVPFDGRNWEAAFAASPDRRRGV
ncbi:MAG TPA: GFA family protein [Candidatus Binataceae bacterium]|nr:GFA family protein [Candidatus Binataceae bacterium]